MKEVVPAKRIREFVGLLHEKALKQCQVSEGNDNKKGFWQAGQAEGFGWAADHLETIIDNFAEVAK